MPSVLALLVVAILSSTAVGQHPPAPPLSAASFVAAGEVSAAQGARDDLVPSGPAGRLPPGPLVVESAAEELTDRVRIEPAIVRVRAAEGESVQPELLVVNGAQWPLDLALTVVSVGAGPDGAPTVPHQAENAAVEAPSAAGWVGLPTSQLHLDPGEQARLRPTVSVPQLAGPGGYLAALRVTARPRVGGGAPGDDDIAAFLLVEVPGIGDGARRRMTATAALTRRGVGVEARVRLESEQTELVAGRLKVSGWWDETVGEAPIPPTIVLAAAPRTQAVGFTAPLLPGRYGLTATVETFAGETLSAHDTAWLWNPLATLIVLVILSVAAVVARLSLRRRP